MASSAQHPIEVAGNLTRIDNGVVPAISQREPLVLTAEVVASPISEATLSVVVAPSVQLEQDPEFLVRTVSDSA